VHVVFLYRLSERRTDGVLDYSRTLAQHLRAAGHDASVMLATRGASAIDERDEASTRIGRQERLRTLRAADWILIQHSPFGLGKRGVAPWLLWLASRVRQQTRLALVIHEPYVIDQRGIRRLMTWWQRRQIVALSALASCIIITTEAWRARIESDAHRHDIVMLPVTSNFPDMRWARAQTRRALGVEDSTVVIATLGSGHDSLLTRHLAAAMTSVSRNGAQCLLLQLGAGTRRIDGPGAVFTPGWQEPRVLASHLGAADLFLAPLIDGVSERRTTVTAAMQHALAIVTTHGPSTHDIDKWRHAGCSLSDVQDVDAFTRNVEDLVSDPVRRHVASAAARRHFEQELAPAVIVAGLLSALQGSRDGDQPAQRA
jgi:glycosyltransferase involved in cell wall biosynthesis